MHIFFLSVHHLKLIFAVTSVLVFTTFGSSTFTYSLQAQTLNENQIEAVSNEIVVWYAPTSASINKAQLSQDFAALTNTYKARFPINSTTLASTRLVELWQFTNAINQTDISSILQELNNQTGIVAFQNYRVKRAPLQPEFISSTQTNQKILDPSQNLLNSPNDSFFSLQYALNNTGTFEGNSTFDADIDGLEAWQLSTGSSSNAVVVFDSGIDIDHPDLVKNLWVNPGEIADNGIDDDGNGYIDDIHGWNSANNNNNVNDTDGHGSHVAGIIGAEANNGVGVAGINHDVKLIALKVFRSNGFSYASDMIKAYEYITKLMQAGVSIVAINQSLGGDVNQTESLKSQNALFVDYARTHANYQAVWVISAGNSNHNHDTNTAYKTPANYQAENIITVASSDYFDQKSDFSDYGQNTVELSAPGTRIASTYSNGQYVYLGGTSMAAPQVAGVLALAASRFPNESARAKVARILATADPITTLNGTTISGKRLNAFNALNSDNQNLASPTIAVNPARGYFKTIDDQASFSTGFVNTTTSSISVNSAQLIGTHAAQFSIRNSDNFGTLAKGAAFGFAIEVTQGPTAPVYNAELSINTSVGTISIPLEAAFQDVPQTTITISGSFEVADKVYDRNRTATIVSNSLSLSGVSGSDDVSLSNLAISFNNRNVGTRTVSIESASLNGTDAGKYILSLSGAPTTTAEITQKELTIGGSFTVNNKSFDGSTSASILTNNLQLNGIISSDEVILTNPEAAFASANPASSVLVQLTNAALSGAQAANYSLNLTAAPTTTAAILASTLSLTGSFTVNAKTYDGSEQATIATNTLSLLGVPQGESVTIDSLEAVFLSKDAETAKTVILNKVVLAGADASKYSLSLINSPTSSATIHPDTLSLTGTFEAADKVYDGTNSASLSQNSLSLLGIHGADNVQLDSLTLEFAEINPNPAVLISITDASLAGNDANNYRLSLQNSPTTLAAIEVAPLKLGGSFTAQDKKYNSAVDALIKQNNLVLEGIIGSDIVQLDSLSLQFETKNAQLNQPVSIQAFTLSGADAAKYAPSLVDSPTALASIFPDTLKIAGSFTVLDKIYDANTFATADSISISLLTPNANDDVSTDSLFISFSEATVSALTPVKIDSLNLKGLDASNYVVNLSDAPTSSATIYAAPLQLAGSFTVADKVYNRSAALAIQENNLQLNGIINNDAVQLDSIEVNATRFTVGTAIPVRITKTVLVGEKAHNYYLDSTLTAPTSSVNITKAPLLLEGSFEVSDKQYDGNTAASAPVDSAALSLVGIIAPDTVQISQLSASFTSANANEQATATLNSVQIMGPNAFNYEIVNTSDFSTIAQITPAPLTITALNDTMAYSGLPYAGGNGISTLGFVADEQLEVLAGELTYSGTAQGAIKMGSYTIIPSGYSAANYALNFQPGTLLITADSLVVSGHFPASGQTKVPISPRLQLFFNQRIVVKNVQDVQVLDAAQQSLEIASINADTSSLTITLANNLAYQSTYLVKVPEGIVQAASGRPNSAYEWSFTTMMEPPTFVGIELAEDSLVRVDQELIISFSQEIFISDKENAIWVQEEGTDEVRYPASFSKSEPTKIALFFNPALKMGSSYKLLIDSAFISNTEGSPNMAAEQVFSTYLQAPLLSLNEIDFIITYANEMSGENPTISWPAIPNATSYQLKEVYRAFLTKDLLNNPLESPIDTVITDTVFVFPPERLTNANAYVYHLRGLNEMGEGPWSATFQINGTLVDIDENEDTELPKSFNLAQNYPNPFNPSTTLSYSLPTSVEAVEIRIYNALGQQMQRHLMGNQAAGNYTLSIEMGNQPTGIYFYQLRAGGFIQTKSMTLVK